MPSRSALQTISDPNLHGMLRDAWNLLLKNSNPQSRSTTDIDGRSINDFSARRDSELHELSRKIRSPSGYKYSPLKPVLLPKTSGGFRVICIPTVHDRIVQRAVLDFLMNGDKCKIINKVSYGFIRGRTVEDAARQARNLRKKYPWAYKTDITKFFDTIPRDSLKELVKKIVRQRSLHPVLLGAIDCEIYAHSRSRKEKISKAGIHENKGVRQGMPLSPFFANLILRDFDQAVIKNGFHMVRYADDLIIFASSQSECLEAHEFCSTQLSKFNLEVPNPGPKSKTAIYKPNDTAEFLGVGLVCSGNEYVLNVLKEQTALIKQRISAMAEFKSLLKEGITIARLGQRLEGAMAGYIAAYGYCNNINQFKMALSNAREKALQKIYEDGLGIKLSTLDNERLRFLGLGRST